MYIDDILNKIKNIHFIGIGGSGMCPIAEILLAKGYQLTGSDSGKSDTLERIKKYGIKIYTDHKKENITNTELVVYSAAIKKDNPELIEAERRGIPTVERSVMLGAVSRKYKRSIAVSGTHGKTTTTAMLTQILIDSGFSPSAIIGGKLPYIGSNGYVGKSDIMVCEACEFVDSFLQLNPYISIILNVDADHLDYFGNLDNIKKSFNKFSNQTTGLLVVNGDDENTLDSIKDTTLPVIKFGFAESNDYYAKNIKINNNSQQEFELFYKNNKACDIKLSVPGEHNVLNALAAISTAHYLGTSFEQIKENIVKFTGVHRRFEVIGNVNGITVADDFAHHPTELTATLSAAMSMGYKKVWAVFQPHTYSRTALLLDDFVKALSIPDVAVISEILAVREENIYNIYAKDLSDKIEGSVQLDSFEEITDYVCSNATSGDLILTLGGGNVYMCANMIFKTLEEKKN